jgi:hypothetical protein
VFGIDSDVGRIAERALREGRMNIPETYDYLVRARRDLWATLEGVPDERQCRRALIGLLKRFANRVEVPRLARALGVTSSPP